MASQTIHRVTLFKIPSKKDQDRLIEIYRNMPSKALKDGKRYIISATVGPTFDDARNQGYTLAALSVFASVEDMKYYDNDCEAHATLKSVAKTIHQGAMMVYFADALA